MLVETSTRQHLSVVATISNRVARLHKEHYGRGPTQTRTYLQDDLVVVLLRGGFTKVEETLRRGGRGIAVIQQRMEFQEVMRQRFIQVIEEELAREVIGVMSGVQQDPDLCAEIFVLAPRVEDPPDDAPVGAPTRRLDARIADWSVADQA